MKSAVILSYHKSNRYKSLHPKCLIEVNGRMLLDYQIDFLKSNGCKEINIIGGYKIDSLKNRGNVNILYYQNYEDSSEVDVLKFALDKIYTSSELYIMFGDVFIPPGKIDSKDSYILTHKHKKGIGCYCYENKIIRMSFDAEDKWGRLIYLNKDALEKLRNMPDLKNYFIYEIINELIDNKCIIRQIAHTTRTIETKKDISNASDLTKT